MIIKYANKWINGDKIINIKKVKNEGCDSDEYPFSILIYTSHGTIHQDDYDIEEIRDYYYTLLGEALLSAKRRVDVDRKARKKFPLNCWDE